MTFLELVNRYRQLSGSQGTGPTTVAGQTGLYLRLVDQLAEAWVAIQMEREGKWKFLWSETTKDTVADQNDYEFRMADGTASIEEDSMTFYDTTEATVERSRLSYVDYDSFKRAFPNYDQDPAGTPSVWTITPGDKIRIYPKPDKVYRLGYSAFAEPVLMTADADVPAIPAHMHMMLVYRALVDFGGFEEARLTMEFANMEYERFFMQMLWQFLREPEEIVVRVE